MKSQTKYLTFHTHKKREYINITAEVQTLVKESGVQEGMVLVSAMHITAGVFVNDNESGILKDLDDFLERLAPEDGYYRHHQTGESNGDAHLKNLVIHSQVILPITKGVLDLGPWQQVFYAEFDGQRSKRVILKVMGEGKSVSWQLLAKKTPGVEFAVLRPIVFAGLQVAGIKRVPS
jgi:secondary thiamine-phosphate synthase enzyme